MFFHHHIVKTWLSNNTGIIFGLIFFITSPTTHTQILVCYTDYSAVEIIISTEDTLHHSSKELELPDPFSAAWSCKSSLSPALLRIPLLSNSHLQTRRECHRIRFLYLLNAKFQIFSLLAFSSNFQEMVLLEKTVSRSKLKRMTALAICNQMTW